MRPDRGAAADPLIGRSVLQYRVDRKLGEGGMGAVYLAVQDQMGKKAAVKVLHPHLSGDQKMLGRFFNEARATSIVKHPGLVEIFNCGQLDDGLAYILMEFLEGEPLVQRLERLKKQGRRLPVETAQELVAQVAAALSATHAEGIIHRDLKPDNIFVVPDPLLPGGERTKILDFGIAKFKDPSGRKTTVGLVLGTPTYMAPEQCEGREDLSDKVDVYALGVILYELLAGEPPFSAETASALMRQHMFKEPRPLKELVPGLPEALGALAADMMRKDPARRPTMAEVAARLGGVAVRGARRGVWSRRGILLLGIAAALLCIGAAGLVVPRRAPRSTPALTRPSPPQAPAPAVPSPSTAAALEAPAPPALNPAPPTGPDEPSRSRPSKRARSARAARREDGGAASRDAAPPSEHAPKSVDGVEILR